MNPATMEALLTLLNSIHPLSEGLVSHLAQTLKTKTISKKQYLLRAGHTSRQICFIEKGLLRCFYEHGETEVSSWFMKEGDVIVSVESFFKQKPSYESIQALEETIVHYVSYDELQFIYKNFLEFNFVARVLAEHYYTLSEQRLYSMRMQRSHERYEHLFQQFPELILRVPSKYIASYLGVSEETLSRIKSKRSIS
jgi:CRP/FNR family transcriptional regulator, anaerobic regulatory protein